MEFNERKMIWDSRNQEPLYAMNEAGLHAVVQPKNQEWNRCLSRCFAAEITVGLLCGGLILVGMNVLSFGDLALAWLATLPWMKIAALTAAAIAKWRRRSAFPRAMSEIKISHIKTHLKNLTKEEQSYGV